MGQRRLAAGMKAKWVRLTNLGKGAMKTGGSNAGSKAMDRGGWVLEETPGRCLARSWRAEAQNGCRKRPGLCGVELHTCAAGSAAEDAVEQSRSGTRGIWRGGQ